MRQRIIRQKSVVGTLAMGVAAGGSLALWGAQANETDGTNIMMPIERPSLNFYGLPGLVDMPSAYALPDGTFVTSISSFAGITRTTLSFQATPRITASFRYAGIQDWNSGGFETYRDRSFDVRFLLNEESRMWPAVTIGLQDFAGTGIYAGEYIVASKTFSTPAVGGSGQGALRVSAGLGWGRLASSGSIGSLFGDMRPAFDPNDTGGELSTDQWFRGDVAPFAGVEWQVNKKLGLKVEYSSDAYIQEAVARNVFTRKSRFNFGAEYQYSEQIRFGAYYLYGSEVGITAQFQLNPRQPLTPLRVAAPPAVAPRPSRASNPQAYGTAWASATSAPVTLRDALVPLLEADGLMLEAVSVSATQAEVRFQNKRYHSMANAIGRTARAMARVMPASVETFRIVPVTSEGLAMSAVILQRSDLERLEFSPDATNALLARAGFVDAPQALPGGVMPDELYPDFSWSLGPYVSPSYFDPDEPVRLDAGLALEASYRPAPGWLVAGQLRYRLAGNIGDSTRVSNSVLPRVRTNGVLYARESNAYIETLYASRQWKPAENLYARISAGYLESMFGGVSGELLWKPQASRLAFGVEANYVMQRDFDRAFGFQDYDVATGHVSAYYEFGDGYLGQIDVGRYLAGDVGATFSLSREFDNGWRVGGFFTLTDVSAADFGEGSFDKGITLTIPLSWFIGEPSRRSISTTIKPIQRDGGARLEVPGRLYEQVRSGHRNAVESQFGRVWE